MRNFLKITFEDNVYGFIPEQAIALIEYPADQTHCNVMLLNGNTSRVKHTLSELIDMLYAPHEFILIKLIDKGAILLREEMVAIIEPKKADIGVSIVLLNGAMISIPATMLSVEEGITQTKDKEAAWKLTMQ